MFGLFAWIIIRFGVGTAGSIVFSGSGDSDDGDDDSNGWDFDID